ncbi:MAG: hypothetical protein FJY77_02715 [Candidatus Altiarchaeales archaeon]|nr:hypothetical protein [Candidatus Altiarchaeales archaeon]
MAGKCILSGQRCKIAGLLALFILLALLFHYLELGRLIYYILLFCAVVWLALELKFDSSGKNIRNAFLVGLFLMVFDFAVENTGGFIGLWTTHQSILPIYFVPLEIIFICTLGGMAWALHLPKKFSPSYSLFDILLFSFFGALGEALLIKNSLMIYTGGWTSTHAFFGYFTTWVILHIIRYKILKV